MPTTKTEKLVENYGKKAAANETINQARAKRDQAKAADKTGKSLGSKELSTTHVTEVVRHQGKLLLPEEMDIDDAIVLLAARKEYEQMTVNITRTLETFIWDGANALAMALDEKFGWAQAVATPGWFGDTPPTLIEQQVDYGVKKQIPWGRFTIPGIEGHVDTSYSKKNGRFIFVANATVKRKHEKEIKELFDLMEEILNEHSIYRGKAIAIRFRDKDGKVLTMPEPSFINLSGVSEENLIYPEDVNNDIRVNLFTPIERMDDCHRYGVPTKRGVLLAGRYGVGKTLAAYVAAKKAVEHSVTYIYCQSTLEFSEVIDFAKQYQPAVVFCEDIDRVTSGERDINQDTILNTLDGIENKNSDIIVVLTTNDVDSISPAMLRPGRLDSVIWVSEPDAQAVVKLIHLYGGHLIEENDEALMEVGELLAGQIPAVVREVVERSKLAAIHAMKPGEKNLRIPASALKIAAKSMRTQLDLLESKQNKAPDPSEMKVLGDSIGTSIAYAIKASFVDFPETTRRMKDQLAEKTKAQALAAPTANA